MCKTADTGFAHWYCANAGWEMLIIQPALSQYNECLMQTVLMRWMSTLSLIVDFWQRTSFIQVIKKPVGQLTCHYDNKGQRHISITETYKRLFHTCINVAFPIAKTCWITITLVILSLHLSYSQPPAPTENIWPNESSLDRVAAIFNTTFSTTFSWMKVLEFRFKFHWNLFLRLGPNWQ